MFAESARESVHTNEMSTLWPPTKLSECSEEIEVEQRARTADGRRKLEEGAITNDRRALALHHLPYGRIAA